MDRPSNWSATCRCWRVRAWWVSTDRNPGPLVEEPETVLHAHAGETSCEARHVEFSAALQAQCIGKQQKLPLFRRTPSASRNRTASMWLMRPKVFTLLRSQDAWCRSSSIAMQGIYVAHFIRGEDIKTALDRTSLLRHCGKQEQQGKDPDGVVLRASVLHRCRASLPGSTGRCTTGAPCSGRPISTVLHPSIERAGRDIVYNR